VPHISRKTSEMWGTQDLLAVENLQSLLGDNQTCFPGPVQNL
jgi:hypothetical protein